LCSLSLVYLGLVVPDHAPDGSPGHRMMTCHVTRHATHSGALDTAVSAGNGWQHGNGGREGYRQQ
jgi:hypothetical protein